MAIVNSSGFRFFALALASLLVWSCNNSDGTKIAGADTTKKDTGTFSNVDVGNPAKGVAQQIDQVHTLYIENYQGHEQLKTLLADKPGQGNKQKLVFQFFRNGAGELNVLLVPAGAGNSKYYLEDAVSATVSGQVIPPLGNKDIFLSNLQLTNKSSDLGPEVGGIKAIDQLKKHMYGEAAYTNAWKYIWLIPDVKTVSEPTGGPGSTSFTKDYLVYKVRPCSDSPKLSNKADDFTITLSCYVNPSPPRKLE